MTQHFLLTSKARTLSSIKIARLSDDEAFSLLCELLWGSKDVVVCPKCSVQHKAYFISTRSSGDANIVIIRLALHQARFLPIARSRCKPISTSSPNL